MASQDTQQSARCLPMKAETIAGSSSEKQTAVLDILFEPSEALHDLAVPLLQTPFNSYSELINCVGAKLHQLAERAASDDSDKQVLYDILGSHPRLGASKATHLSDFSKLEQANLSTPGEGGEEAQQLEKLNEEYEKTFPGLRYVVFVCGRRRDVIMEDMRHRIDAGDVSREINTTITVSLLPCPRSYCLYSI
ncbi:conserved hypothetical protein [Microsporum canis CBS 113480]|uniref:Oxo-4-hydroxy-4-carboxy-5-ureidoimidazoline decarboxylase domain-containing protein n=1 Tax=Arthroderma otae (strain ATCC MYA-4605 / CBS 113480) TaxID=554155 RepID=C5FQZ6_ARTOC|nr:conserved hypothetical protein [Microsporum canis CBS 113480]EEQ32299.1 conserved hypothetical protein [Microsporum canis CBS 113480]